MPATIQYLGCVVGSSLGTAAVSLNLNAALDTTGGGVGHSGGFAAANNDIAIIATCGYSNLGAGVLNSDSNGGTWTELSGSMTNMNNNTGLCRLYFRRLNIDAAGGPTVNISGVSFGSYGTSAVAFVLRGARHDSAALGNPATYIGVGFAVSGVPDPPALPANTPADNCFILAIYYDETIDLAGVVGPTNYTLTQVASAAGGSFASQVGGAWRLLAAPSGSAENPAAFTGYSSGAWTAVTIPLDPGPLNAVDSVSETAATSTTQTATASTGIGESAAAADVVTATKGNADGRAFGGVYTVDFALSGWGGRTLRQVITPAILASVPPGPMGARFEFAAGTSTTIGPAYIGHAGAGDAYDFDGAQVQLTFDGGGTTKAVAGAASVDTDKVAFPGYDPTKNLVVSLYMGAGTANPKGYGF